MVDTNGILEAIVPCSWRVWVVLGKALGCAHTIIVLILGTPKERPVISEAPKSSTESR